MKPLLHRKHYLVTVLYALALSLCNLNGQTTNDSPSSTLEQPSQILPTLLKMQQAELALLRQTIERIEAMPETERMQLRQNILKMEQADRAQLQQMRQQFENIPKATRAAMHHRWLSMSSSERREWRKKLREMPPQERAAAFKADGFLPPPHHKPAASKQCSTGPTEPKSE